LRAHLEELTPVDSPALKPVWSAAAQTVLNDGQPARYFSSIPEQFLILITCRDEKHQVELLARFQDEGQECKALIS
jgi:hypothetical protein